MTVFVFVLNFKSCSGQKTVTRGTLFVNTDQMNALETKLRWLFLYMRGRYKNVFHFWQGFKKGVFKIMYTELSQMSKKICYFSQPQKQWRVFRYLCWRHVSSPTSLMKQAPLCPWLIVLCALIPGQFRFKIVVSWDIIGDYISREISQIVIDNPI